MSRICFGISVFFLLALMFDSNQIVAQQKLITLGPNNDGEKQFKDLIDDLRDSSLFQLNGRIKDIERSCDLSEKQRQKLRVAAKGAVAEFVGAEERQKREQLRRYQQQAGIDPDKKDKGDDDGGGGVVRNFSFVFRMKPSILIDTSDRWKKSLKSILTDEQMQRYRASQAERQKFIRKAAVDQFVAEIDLKLFLHADQREGITKIIDKKFGDKLVDALRFFELNRNRGFVVNNGPRKPKYDKLVKDILSADQLQEWNRSVEPRLEELGRIQRR